MNQYRNRCLVDLDRMYVSRASLNLDRHYTGIPDNLTLSDAHTKTCDVYSLFQRGRTGRVIVKRKTGLLAIHYHKPKEVCPTRGLFILISADFVCLRPSAMVDL